MASPTDAIPSVGTVFLGDAASSSHQHGRRRRHGQKECGDESVRAGDHAEARLDLRLQVNVALPRCVLHHFCVIRYLGTA